MRTWMRDTAWYTHRKDEAVRAALTLTALHGDTCMFEAVPGLTEGAWRVIARLRPGSPRITVGMFSIRTGEWVENTDLPSNWGALTRE